MYSQIKDKIIGKPMDLPFRVTLSDGSTRTSLSELNEKQLAGIGIYPCMEVRPEYDKDKQYLGEPKMSFDGEIVTATYPVMDKSTEQIETEEQERKDTELARLKSERDKAIEAGYVYKEHTFWIDKGSQGDILVAMLMAQQNPSYETDWKTKEGWVHLANAEIQQLAMEVFVYVGSLFQKERDDTLKIVPEKVGI